MAIGPLSFFLDHAKQYRRVAGSEVGLARRRFPSPIPRFRQSQISCARTSAFIPRSTCFQLLQPRKHDRLQCDAMIRKAVIGRVSQGCILTNTYLKKSLLNASCR